MNNNLCKQTMLKLVAYLITDFLKSSHMGKMLLTSKSVIFFKSENFQLNKTCEKKDGAIAISTCWKSHPNYIKYSS